MHLKAWCGTPWCLGRQHLHDELHQRLYRLKVRCLPRHNMHWLKVSFREGGTKVQDPDVDFERYQRPDSNTYILPVSNWRSQGVSVFST